VGVAMARSDNTTNEKSGVAAGVGRRATKVPRQTPMSKNKLPMMKVFALRTFGSYLSERQRAGHKKVSLGRLVIQEVSNFSRLGRVCGCRETICSQRDAIPGGCPKTR
jgi:hypothetical protein